MKTRTLLFVLAMSAVLSLAACRPSPSPTAMPSPVPPTKTPTATPSATPTATPTPTPLPPLLATAQAFQAAVQATATAAAGRLAVVQEKLGQTVACQGIPSDQFVLTSPIPFPADVGEAMDGEMVIFRVPEGTVVRAPIGGNISLGHYGGPFTVPGTYFTIETANYEVLVLIPTEESQILLPGYDPTQYYPGTQVQRGDPIARVGPRRFAGKVGQVTGLTGEFNVAVLVQTPYPDWTTVPLGISSNLWYGEVPQACSDWPPVPEASPAPTAAPMVTPVATPQPTAALATPAPFTGTLPTPTGQIAYLSGDQEKGGEIYLLDLAQGSSQQLTHGEWNLIWATDLLWSPNGKYLAFIPGYGPSQGTLTLLDVATGEARRTGEKGAFAWSPDGQHIALTRQSDLVVLDVQSGVTQTLFSAMSRVENAIWSPDGTQLAFAVRRRDAEGSEIYLLPANGGDPQPLTDFYGQDKEKAPWSPISLAWSPDGRQIAFRLEQGPYPPASAVCTVEVAGGSWKCYSTSAWSLQWLPDSQRLLCDSYLLLDTASGQITKLTDLPVKGGDLSPDGHFIVFESQADYYLTDIYLLHVYSGQIVARLTANFVSDWAPAWRPR